MPASEAPPARAVLLVDDDVSFTGVIADMLGEQGYRPERAHDHAQAMERLSTTEYAVALIGLVLPGGDGIALADHIRDQDAFDAMTRGYPGRPPRTPEQAMAELQAGAGSQFDPRMVRLFVAEYPERAHGLP